MKIYLLFIITVSQFSISLASEKYQSKVCNEIPYILVVAKAATYLRQSSLAYISSKYEKLNSFGQKTMQAKLHNASKTIDSSICENQNVIKDLVRMTRSKFKYINKLKKLCNSSKDINIPPKIIEELGTVDDRDSFIIHSWRDYHQYSLQKICKEAYNSGECDNRFAPQFRYMLDDENISEASLCRAAVKEGNLFLKWTQSTIK